uniref:LAGLIDADG endonuclease n=1 Tax=Ganoderma leucocontextum TaxID=1566825 RepID=A0A2S1WBH3_9APHY|nr:LAGLIDADG endonuclease [Ganoderma leucocontextum]AWJ63924.1 LAGLIDADG endonuclease [Ganoderma leucocontextum]
MSSASHYNKSNFNTSVNRLQYLRLSTLPINSKEILDNYTKGKLPIKLLNSSYFSPWFIVGEAEGNFDSVISQNPKVLPKFRLRLTSKCLDIVLLCAIKIYFGSGSLYLRKETGVFTLEVSSQETIKKI